MEEAVPGRQRGERRRLLASLFPPVVLPRKLAGHCCSGLSCGPEFAAGLALGVGFVRSGAVRPLAPFDEAFSSSREH